jgi:hypothetical protein
MFICTTSTTAACKTIGPRGVEKGTWEKRTVNPAFKSDPLGDPGFTSAIRE